MRFWGRGAERGAVEVFPHVRLDRAARLVEFDGRVPINAHAEDGSVVFLEVIACRPDTKEHESLVVTEALGSHVHAALLLLGLEAGHPGGWKWEGESLVPVAPEGAALRVTVAWLADDGARIQHAATDLIVSRGDGRTFSEYLEVDEGEASRTGSTHVFAGSRFVEREGREFYDADGTGLIVGLHTFGSEVVGLTRVLSHEASVLEPEWIARREMIPERGTAVVVRLWAVEPTDAATDPAR